MIKTTLSLCALILFSIVSPIHSDDKTKEKEKEIPAMKITSSAFTQDTPIPKKYTCDGDDISPPLAFDQVPAGTISIALVVDDPDAPSGIFDHWIAWNIPAETKGLSEHATLTKQGINHFGETRYRGPCPPRGKTHHYRFKVYALDTTLTLPYGSSKDHLEKAMAGHILGQGELIGTYQRT